MNYYEWLQAKPQDVEIEHFSTELINKLEKVQSDIICTNQLTTEGICVLIDVWKETIKRIG